MAGVVNQAYCYIDEEAVPYFRKIREPLAGSRHAQIVSQIHIRVIQEARECL